MVYSSWSHRDHSPLFCLILGLGSVLLKPDSGLDESDCLSAILRTFLLDQRDGLKISISQLKWLKLWCWASDLVAHLMGAPKMLSWLASVNTRETIFNILHHATTSCLQCFLQNDPHNCQRNYLWVMSYIFWCAASVKNVWLSDSNYKLLC